MQVIDKVNIWKGMVIEMFDKLDDLIARYEEIMNELHEPTVADNQARFRSLMKEQSNLQPIVEAYTEYKKCKETVEDSLSMLESENDEEMREMLKEELNDAKKRIEELEQQLKILLLPKDPNDDKNVIVEIRAGAGGDEAALFAAEIYRMYVHYAESRRWKVETMEVEEIGIGGMKSVTFMISGQGAYSVMKYESGVHRVQRVPETESGGRIHTSTISVAVMPEVDEDIDIKIEDKDIRIDVMRASGNGGQCVNTTDSAVRLTHYPTGIVYTARLRNPSYRIRLRLSPFCVPSCMISNSSRDMMQKQRCVEARLVQAIVLRRSEPIISLRDVLLTTEST